MSDNFATKTEQLKGPILVLGASGFVGANLLKFILSYRQDVFGTSTKENAWRLNDVPKENIIITDLLHEKRLSNLINEVRPNTVFNCIAYGGYSFEENSNKIYETNFILLTKLLPLLSKNNIQSYIHAGTSSEYGYNSAAPSEDAILLPNSDYSVSKAAAANYIYFMGKKNKFPCANLRLYAVYGPLEDSARLIPTLIKKGLEGTYPEFVNPEISRDFIYVEDVCEAFILAAINLKETQFGESFNLGTGHKTTIKDIANVSKQIFSISDDPKFTAMNRKWDLPDWYSNSKKINNYLHFTARTSFKEGLNKTIDWYKSLSNQKEYQHSSKIFDNLDRKFSVSAIIACYKDEKAIPIMYHKLSQVFKKINVEYEIIFVNDCSPDGSEEVIRDLTSMDKHILGITHSRNFGSQAAFRSGMEIATKNSVVLLDGDLQDPPEIIEQFVEKWREGYEVIFGRRVKREAPLYMQFAYKLFYRLFDAFSYISIPHDAGDFSLMDKKVVNCLLQFPERDLFIRGIRAFAGFKQVGIDYIRPERQFGVSTNNLFKNIGWAKKGILSFSHTPLNLLSLCGFGLLSITLMLALLQVLLKYLHPEAVPQGITTTLLLIMFFGSVNFFAISIIGEYIRKILEEVKGRPHFIRRHIIFNGEINHATQSNSK